MPTGGRSNLEILEPRQLLSNIFSVTNTLDDSSTGSLRWAIGQVNADTTDTAASPDKIDFAIPTSDPGFAAGVWTIAPASALPTITQPVVIDGYTQPRASPNTLAQGDNAVIAIQLAGTNVSIPTDGFTLSGGESLVRGLSFTGFTNGIHLEGSGGDAVVGDFVGVSADGISSRGNSNYGVFVDGAPFTSIGGTNAVDRNLISSNSMSGIEIINSSEDTVQGDYIGTDKNGTSGLGNYDGIQTAESSNVTIGGTSPRMANLISGNSDGAIDFNPPLRQSVSDQFLIEDNLIGVDVTGSLAIGNGYGLYLSSDNLIIGNVISGNSGNGVVCGANNCFQGNFIGTDASGDLAIGNDGNGIFVEGTRVTIGGAAAGEGNVISANTGNGIFSNVEGLDYDVVQGNDIGTNGSGSIALGNGKNGLDALESGGFTIGGTTAGAGNVISGNVDAGLSFFQGGGNIVTGNIIGANADGTAALANGTDGIDADSDGNFIGLSSVFGNTISGNLGNGIVLQGGSNVLRGDLIGVGNGIALGNGASGIIEYGSANIIGAITATDLIDGNEIAYNSLAGVTVINGATGNQLRSNSIFDNAKLGIDLGGDGVTLNTPGGPHTGPNNLQNYPVLTNTFFSNGQAAIQGTLNSTPNATFTIQFFSSPTADPSGYGQGQTYLGELTSVKTDANGNANFTFVANGSLAGQFLSVTATDPGGNTSEFSQDIQAVPLPDVSVSVAKITANSTFGGNLAYTFTVANMGTADASNVVITDDLPTSLANLMASATMGSFQLVGNVFTDTVASLAAGASFQVQFTATAGSVGTITNTLVAQSSTLDADLTNNSATTNTLVDRAASTIHLTLPAPPLEFGEPVFITASVPAADGTVTFFDNGKPFFVAPVNPASNGQGGTALVETSDLQSGTSAITAMYSGDANFAPVLSDEFSLTINPQVTSTTLSASPNPSTFGQSVTFRANVVGIDDPTGNVVFLIDGSAVATVPVVVDMASFSISTLNSGTHTVTAEYSGDTNFTPSNSNAIAQIVQPATTVTTLLVSPNPSIGGMPVTLTALVTGTATPSGIVTFFDGNSVLGQAPLSSNGSAQLVVASLGAGSHALSVTYGGNSTLASSASTVVEQVVNATPVVNPAPVVESVQRFGIHAQPTSLVITFSVPLALAPAQNLSNYILLASGPKKLAISSATLSADGLTVVLKTRQRLNVHRVYAFEVVGTVPGGVTSAAGVPLDGYGRGVPGTSYSTSISIHNLVLPKKPPKTHAVRKSK